MQFALSPGDVFILFFLTLGPLKAILPFARATHGTELAFQRTVAGRATATATVIVLVVGLLAPFVLTNWHVSPPAIIITGGIILFYQALHIVTQTLTISPPPTAAVAGPLPSPAIAIFPIAMPAIVTAPGIAAIATVAVIGRHDLAREAMVIVILLAVMALNLLTLWNNETILKHGLAGVLPVIGWVLAVLQAALAVQMVIYALRVLEVLRWPVSPA
jgi:small neutral amino acid transporter SnatA (MarC family)